LVNLEALKKVGLMDEKFFLLWDDIDWGVKFKEHGYKVCISCDSIIYHPDFSTQRDSYLKRYYSSRNALYFFSKAKNGKYFKNSYKRIKSIRNFFKIVGEESQKNVVETAIKDFRKNKMGKYDDIPITFSCKWENLENFNLNEFTNKNIILIPESYKKTLELLENYPNINWSIMIEDFRFEQYENLKCKIFNYKNMLEVIKTAKKIKAYKVFVQKSYFHVPQAILNYFYDLILLRNNSYYLKQRDKLIFLKLSLGKF